MFGMLSRKRSRRPKIKRPLASSGRSIPKRFGLVEGPVHRWALYTLTFAADFSNGLDHYADERMLLRARRMFLTL